MAPTVKLAGGIVGGDTGEGEGRVRALLIFRDIQSQIVTMQLCRPDPNHYRHGAAGGLPRAVRAVVMQMRAKGW